MALKAKARATKAELEARKAAMESRAALQDAARSVRELAAAMAAQVRSAGLDQRAGELAGRLRDSDVIRDAQARGAEVAARAREAAKDAQLDQRASQLAARMREADAAAFARQFGDDALGRTGTWLASGRIGEKLGLARAGGSRVPVWLAALLGVVGGYLIGVLTAPRRGADVRSEVGASAQRFVHQATGEQTATQTVEPLADRVRQRLRDDARTAELGALNVNVVEGTVFVRGRVPAGADEDQVRDVIAGVEGVSDVDVQLSVAT